MRYFRVVLSIMEDNGKQHIECYVLFVGGAKYMTLQCLLRLVFESVSEHGKVFFVSVCMSDTLAVSGPSCLICYVLRISQHTVLRNYRMPYFTKIAF